MLMLVGLGNPGDKYAKTRHNIGFMAVDAIADRHGFSAERARFQGIVREGRFGSGKVLVLKPQTFMNESGRSVAEAAKFYRVAPEEIVVFHDELDLAPGKLRVKSGGGHAGHNGLRSIHAHLGEAYRRVRLGIGHPGDKARVSGYVLHDFAKADATWLQPLLDGVAEHAPLLAALQDAKFQSNVAQKLHETSSTSPARANAKRAGQEAAAKPASSAPVTEDGGPFDALRRLIGK